MEKKPYPSETQERFIVRLPDGMRELIAQSAKEHGRSMNSDIVARLQESFNPQPGKAFDMAGYQALKTDILLEVLDALREAGQLPK